MNVHFFKKIFWQSLLLVVISISAAMITNYYRSDALVLPGDWSLEARILSKDGKNISISLDEAERLFKEGKILFLDARPFSDYENGHIQSAVSLPFHEFDQRFEEVMAEVPNDQMIVTYCDGETCTLSHDLADILLDMGFPEVRVLFNGWSEWKKNQLPVEQEETVQ